MSTGGTFYTFVCVLEDLFEDTFLSSPVLTQFLTFVLILVLIECHFTSAAALILPLL